ncbi:hypothetical protein [Halobacteriovorax sp. HLS]|uniref:hypothetical protein n=1 Tax=Halobacteriovorax sp. HLS TaxID=2234000 RepID=UPI000FD7205F|nr:hypothetical protein [Halobacteriovorax sp. HLS]
MPRTDAFYDKHSLFINSALIACHANTQNSIFRQKDLKFFIELLSNWMETTLKGHCLEVQNTQIQRILESLKEEGLLKKNLIKNRPTYQFTSIGLLEIITRIVSDDSTHDLQNFYFLYHFVSLYRDKMNALIVGQKTTIPTSYSIEIKHLLNPHNLIERQTRKIELEVEKLIKRISEAEEMSNLSKSLIDKNIPIKEIIKKIETRYPYQLNNQRNMTELFKTLSPDVQLIELVDAPIYRAKTLWTPLLNHYNNYLNSLRDLLKLHSYKL